jgi:predicted CoA-binding protein
MSDIWSKVNKNIPSYLRKFRNIAVVGLSAEPDRPSYKVSEYMQYQGYNIIPVNPKYDEIFGTICYKDLEEISGKIEIVNIFRKSNYIEPIVDQAIRVNAKLIWMQLGVINEKAAMKALENGIDVVMDRCIKIEHAAA